MMNIQVLGPYIPLSLSYNIDINLCCKVNPKMSGQTFGFDCKLPACIMVGFHENILFERKHKA